jgi:hypothetical protein
MPCRSNLDRDMKRYKDALDELLGQLSRNTKVIQSMGGILPGDWDSTVTAINRLRANIQKGVLVHPVAAREKIAALFNNSTLLQKSAYAKIRSKF